MSFLQTKVLLTGANGVVGIPLCTRLQALDVDYVTISRKVPDDQVNQQKHRCLQWNLDDEPNQQMFDALGSVTTLIHCAPLWLLPKHLKRLQQQGVRRIIAFSSSSLISKSNSANTSESQLVQSLSSAETALNEFCNSQDIALTIFRPSMIYGYGRDQNVTHLAKFIRNYRCMLLAGEAKGLRQPVHADDLVEACLRAIDQSTTYGNTYNLAGGQVLSYRQMIDRIFAALQIRPRILSLPLGLYRVALRVASLVRRFSYTPEMANRMNQDLNYDCSDAETDFGYAPQTFLSNPQRDLPIR